MILDLDLDLDTVAGTSARGTQGDGTPALTTSDWVFWRIYPGGFQLLDQALGLLVTRARDLARTLPSWSGSDGGNHGHWFFLRYIDGRGPHLRLRFAGSVADLAHLETVAEGFFSEALLALERPGVRRGTFVGVDQAVYDPELSKYGGDDGLELSYPVFEASSDLALSVIAQGRSSLRFPLAAALTCGAVIRVLGAGRAESFLSRYKSYWSGQGVTDASAMLTRIEHVSASRSASLLEYAIGLTNGDLAEPVREYIQLVGDRLATWSPASASPPAGNLLFNYVHLMNNRLGIRPWEEAVLAACLERAGESSRARLSPESWAS